MTLQEVAIDYSDFKYITEKEGSMLLLDITNKIAKVVWNGEVNKETASFILNEGADLIEDGSATMLLLNRKNLTQFSKEARQWIKDDLLKNRGKVLIHRVRKVATVKSTTTMGNLFANVVSSAIKIVFPKLKMTHFDKDR